MSEQMKPITAIGTPDDSNYVVAHGVATGQHSDTTSTPSHFRTVVTSVTTGRISLRYAPRATKPNGGTETFSR